MDIKRIFGLIFLCIYGLFIISPLYVTVITSFKDINDVFNIPPKLIPFIDFQPTLNPYITIFSTRVGYTFIVSLIVASLATLIAIILSLLAAYGFSRFPKAKMNDEGSFFMLLTLRMVPPFAVVLPILIYWSTLGLYDTYPALIYTYTIFSIPLAVWLLKGFVDDIPKSVEDAAMIDGYSWFNTFRKFILPLLGGGLAASIALVWLFLWNEFLFALKIAGGKVVTYPAYLPQLRVGQRTQWDVLAAIGTLAIIPPLIILVLFRKYIIRLYLARS
ncbi:MAG: carbohydrate ABC transporter permease [Candidatus Methanomethylicaceae archaeon]